MNEERRNKLVNILATLLTRLCERNDHFTVQSPITRFHALQPPQITITTYLLRIARYTNCSEECFVLALIYIDRLINKNGNFQVLYLNVHRLIIISIMVSAKYFDDQYYNNAYFATVGGVSCKEIGLLEIEFLFMLNFNLYVETGLFELYSRRLIKHSRNHGQRKQGQEVLLLKTFPDPTFAAQPSKLYQVGEQTPSSVRI